MVTQYQTTRHVEEALERLTEAYMALGIVDEAQTAAAVLGHNFPDSAWYKHAYALVKAGGVEPRENKGSWISQAFKRHRAGLEPARHALRSKAAAIRAPRPVKYRHSGDYWMHPRSRMMTHLKDRPCSPGSRFATSC